MFNNSANTNNSNIDKKNINELIVNCINNLSYKDFDDFELNAGDSTEIIVKNADNNEDSNKGLNSNKYNLLEKLGKIYLLRIQIVNLLRHFTKSMTVPQIKGMSVHDDRQLIDWTLENGYDNYPTSVYDNTKNKQKGKISKAKIFSGKMPEELNQRVRKIILHLNSIKQTINYNEIAMNFGRLTELNKENIALLVDEGSYKDFVEKVYEKGKLTQHGRNRNTNTDNSRKRKELPSISSEEVVVYNRILFFDRFYEKIESGKIGRKLQKFKKILEVGMEKFCADEVLNENNVEEEVSALVLP